MIDYGGLAHQVMSMAFSAGLIIQRKGVTAKYIDTLLKKNLLDALPGSGYKSKVGDDVHSDTSTWFVDPLDGYVNYLNNFPYAISIALVDERTGDTQLGVIYSPTDNTVMWAVKGSGAWKQTTSSRKALTPVKEGPKTIGLIGMPTNKARLDRTLAIEKEMCKAYSDVKCIGPASLDICRVACGHARTFVHLGLNEWDIKAGTLILEEAGGRYKCYGDIHVFSWEEV